MSSVFASPPSRVRRSSGVRQRCIFLSRISQVHSDYCQEPTNPSFAPAENLQLPPMAPCAPPACQLVLYVRGRPGFVASGAQPPVEMRPVLPARAFLINETQVSLMDKCGWLQCVALAFLPWLPGREPMGFVVDDGVRFSSACLSPGAHWTSSRVTS
jgi:hypothetical protein